jgi:hypothetical protein
MDLPVKARTPGRPRLLAMPNYILMTSFVNRCYRNLRSQVPELCVSSLGDG